MNPVNVVGIGPGNPDWMLPVAKRTLLESQLVIGGARQLEFLKGQGPELWILESNYPETVELIRAEYPRKTVSVAVSGDACFYSLLTYLKRNLPGIPFRVIPGISSLQYLFSRIGTGYEDAILLSAHGRALDLAEAMAGHRKAGVLTDSRMTPVRIAEDLRAVELGDHWLVVGENLSYPDERISLYSAAELKNQEFSALNAVLILDPVEGNLLKEGWAAHVDGH